MNCQDIKNELILYVGQSRLPAELADHLKTCLDCRTYIEDLNAVAELAGKDSDFYLSEVELEQAVAGVDRALDKIELEAAGNSVGIWRSYIPAVAALIAIVGISLTLSISGLMDGRVNTVSDLANDTALVSVDQLEDTELDGLLVDFALERNDGAGELLLDDLTEEEYQYLTENMDIGDIL